MAVLAGVVVAVVVSLVWMTMVLAINEPRLYEPSGGVESVDLECESQTSSGEPIVESNQK